MKIQLIFGRPFLKLFALCYRLGMELGFGPGDFVLDGDPAPPSLKGGQSPPNFRPMFIAAKWLDG